MTTLRIVWRMRLTQVTQSSYLLTVGTTVTQHGSSQPTQTTLILGTFSQGEARLLSKLLNRYGSCTRPYINESGELVMERVVSPLTTREVAVLFAAMERSL